MRVGPIGASNDAAAVRNSSAVRRSLLASAHSPEFIHRSTVLWTNVPRVAAPSKCVEPDGAWVTALPGVAPATQRLGHSSNWWAVLAWIHGLLTRDRRWSRGLCRPSRARRGERFRE